MSEPDENGEIAVGVWIPFERLHELEKAEADLVLANQKLEQYESGFFGRAAARMMKQCEAYQAALTITPWNLKRISAAIRNNANIMKPEWSKEAAIAVLQTIKNEVARRVK